MSKASEYETRATALTRTTLMALWEDVRDNKSTPGWPPGKAFEYLVLRAFQLEGAVVRWPYEVTMADEVVEQIDGVIHLPNISCLIETKAHAKKLAIEPVAKLRNQLLRRPAGAIGAVFSLMGFTRSAKILTWFLAPQTIVLWESDEFDYALRNDKLATGLVSKYHNAIERGLPDFHLLAEI